MECDILMWNGMETVTSTIFGDWFEYTLENVVIDNDVEKANAVEVAVKYQREDRAE